MSIVNLDYNVNNLCEFLKNKALYGDKFELEIDKWTDYDGEQIQVISNKNVYLLSANKCYMVKEK